MKKVKFLGKKLSREQLRSLSGGNEIVGGDMCITKSCLTSADCADVTGCNCYRNYNPGTGKPDKWGYCQIRINGQIDVQLKNKF